MSLKVSYTRKQCGEKSSVSFKYVDELENMNDSESATLDLKITVVNVDEGLKSIVFNFDRRERFIYELSSYKDDVQDEDDGKFTSYLLY